MKGYYKVICPVFIIILGLLIWLSKLGMISIVWRRDWPLIIVAIGLIQLLAIIFKRA